MSLRKAFIKIGLLVPFAAQPLLATGDPGFWIRPIPPCLLLDTSSAGRLDENQPWPLYIDGNNGGTDCSFLPPAEAQGDTAKPWALLVRAEVSNAQGPGRLLAGPSDRELNPILTYEKGAAGTVLPFALLEICRSSRENDCSRGDLLVASEGAVADLRIEIIGLLEPASPDAIGLGNGEEETHRIPKSEVVSRSSAPPYWDLGPADSLTYSDGLVGIGTAEPEAQLHVEADLTGELVSQPAYFGGETLSNYFEPRYPTLFLRRNSGTRGANLALGNSSGRVYLYGSPSGFKIYDDSQTQRLFLDANGHLGIGELGNDPAYTLHVGGGVVFRDPADTTNLFEILPKASGTNGYGGGSVYAATRVARFLTPYQSATNTKTRGSLALGSPEVWGAESSYLYAFGNKNIRLGIANDGYRRAEIELYNNNTSHGRILFRTGSWQDPNNLPSSPTSVRMMIDETGKVGIGTSTPTEMLDVQGNIKLDGKILSAGDICIGSCE